MRSLLLKILKFIGFLAIGILLLYLAFRGIDFEHLRSDFREANYSWIALSLAFAIIAYLSRAIRWIFIIEPLGHKPSLKNSFYSLMIGYLANFAFPRIGEITRCATLGKKEKIPVDKLVGTVIVERAVDFLCLMILMAVLIVFRFEKFGNFLNDSVIHPIGDKISTSLNFSTIIWISILVFIAGIILGYLIFREQLSNIKFIAKGKNIIKGIIEGLKSVYKLKKRGWFIFHTILIWTSYLMMTWVVVFSIPATQDLQIMDGLFLLVIGGLAMSAPVQSGIGAFHWIVSRGLVGVYGKSLEEGLVFATLAHESQSLLAILLGSLSFVLIFRKKKSSKLSQKSSENLKEAS